MKLRSKSHRELVDLGSRNTEIWPFCSATLLLQRNRFLRVSNTWSSVRMHRTRSQLADRIMTKLLQPRNNKRKYWLEGTCHLIPGTCRGVTAGEWNGGGWGYRGYWNWVCPHQSCPLRGWRLYHESEDGGIRVSPNSAIWQCGRKDTWTPRVSCEGHLESQSLLRTWTALPQNSLPSGSHRHPSLQNVPHGARAPKSRAKKDERKTDSRHGGCLLPHRPLTIQISSQTPVLWSVAKTEQLATGGSEKHYHLYLSKTQF